MERNKPELPDFSTLENVLKSIELGSSVFRKQEGGKHYKEFVIQPVVFIQKNKLSFIEGNIIKYICRHKKKGGIEDLRKAKHYLELLAEIEYGEKV